MHRETIMPMHIVEYGEENDQQLFIEVYLPPLVHWIQIDRLLFLQHSLTMCDGTGPVDLVVARMKVPKHKEEEILVVAVELL